MSTAARIRRGRGVGREQRRVMERDVGPRNARVLGNGCPAPNKTHIASYREQVEAEIAALTRDLLDSAEEHYGAVPHVDVFGVVVAVSYTPDDAELDDDQAFTHDGVSYRFSDQKPWVQVGVLRKALLLAESGE